MEFEPGLRIGPYRILKPLGSGGMGAVYLAQDERLDRRVALKILTGRAGEDAARRIRHEARAVARLNHPNIAAVYDVFEHDSRSFLVMEYVDGERLTEIARSQPVPIDRMIDIGLQLVDALAYAHTAGIIHRDVKPANVMLTRDGKVKVLDLGLARVTSSDPDGSTISVTDVAVGFRAGTPAYMAPERLAGEPADAASDIYSAGVLLFEILTGTRPFMAPDAVSLAVSLATKPMPRATSRRADVPPMLDDVLARAMATDQSARFASAAELYDELIRVRDSRPPLRDSRSGVRDSRSDTHVAPPVATQRRWRPLLLIGAVAIAIAAMALWFGLRRPLVSLPANLAIAPVVASSTNDGELDELAALLGSVLSRNVGRVPGVTLVASTAASATYRTAISVRRTVTGVAAEVALEQEGRTSPVWQDHFEGDALGVLRFVVNGVAGVIERDRSDGSLTPDDRTRLRQLPTEDAHALASFFRGASLFDTSDSLQTDEKAANAFSEAIERDRAFAAAHAGLSQTYYLMFLRNPREVPRWDMARKAAEQAVAIDPASDQAQMATARVMGAFGHKDAAIDYARRAVALTPDGDDSHRTLGIVLIERDQPDEGFRALRTATALGPRNWSNHYALARQLLLTARFEEALVPLQKVLDLRPTFQSAYVNLGVAYTNLGNWEMAIGNFKRAADLNPGDAAAVNNLATAYYWSGRFADALDSYAKAIALDPSAPVRHMNLGDAYERLGRREDARKAYTNAITRADAQLTGGFDARTEAIAAMCEVKLGRGSAGERRALAAFSAASQDPSVVHKLAVVYALTGRIDMALSTLEKAVGLGYSVVFARADPDLSVLSDQPRFKALIAPKQE